MPDRRSTTLYFAAVLLTATCLSWNTVNAQDDPIPVADEPEASFTLSVEGECPGTVTVKWSGAGEAKRQGLLIGNALGTTTIPVGQPCAGTALGIQGGVRLVSPPGFFSTGAGSGSIGGRLPISACGKQLQLLKGGSCELSNVAQLPEQIPG